MPVMGFTLIAQQTPSEKADDSCSIFNSLITEQDLYA
jgi:hypothetical protein